jgi:hypothetical protein
MRKIPGDLPVIAIAVAAGLGLYLIARHHPTTHSQPAHQPVASQAVKPTPKH